VGGAEASEF